MANLPPAEPPNLGNRGGQQPNPYGQQPPQNPYGQQPPLPPQNPYGQQPPPNPYGQQPPRPGTGPLPPYPPQPGLPPAPPPRLGGQPGYPPNPNYVDQDLPPAYAPQFAQRPPEAAYAPGMPLITERRVEYVAWGTVVLIMGCTVVFAALDPVGAINMLSVATPLSVGFILLMSALIQRLIFSSFRVTRITWSTAIISLSFGATRLIGVVADSSIWSQMIYFIGFLIIISGVIILLQVFRAPEADM